MLTNEVRTEIALELYDCFHQKRTVGLLTQRYPDIEVEDSYRIQEQVIDQFKESGARLCGYKVGLTSKPMQEMAGTNEPDFSALMNTFFFPEGCEIPDGTFVAPLAEIELAFVMKQRLAGPGLTIVDVLRATDFVVPAIEVVDLRVAMAPGMDVRDTIADLAAVGAVVLGGNPISLNDIDVRAITGELSVNGEVKEAGPASAVLGNPLNAVLWLANKLGEFGVAFEPGDVVLSGSFIRLASTSPGDTVTASFSHGLGDVSFSLAASSEG